MKKYLLKRIIMAAVTIWAVITITFILMHSVPGNPFMSESKMPKVVFDNLQRKYGLDKPETKSQGLFHQIQKEVTFCGLLHGADA